MNSKQIAVATKPARAWLRPEVRRFEAGRAELQGLVGPDFESESS